MSEIFNYDQGVFIEGYDNYLLFANGNILNCENNRWLKHTKRKDGYIIIGLSKDKKTKLFLLHQLIAKAFIANPENKKFVDHINRVKDDNRLQNLRWATDSENCKNHPLSSVNKSGFRGVSFHKNRNAWDAQWCDSILGKIKGKAFSIKKYGAVESLKQAVLFRYQMEQENDYTKLQTPEQFFKSNHFLKILYEHN